MDHASKVKFNFNHTHPELEKDEIFLGNKTREEFEEVEYTTKRTGKAAYCSDGSRIDDKNVFPIFVKKKELGKLIRHISPSR